MAKTIYMLTCDYGGMDNFYEAAFVDESERNELALAFAEELEHANFNRNIEGWLNSFPPTRKGIESAIGYLNSTSNTIVFTKAIHFTLILTVCN